MEFLQVQLPHGVGIGNDAARQNPSAHPGIEMEIPLAQPAPLAPLPLNSVHIDGAVLTEQSRNDAMQGIGHVGYKHGVHLAKEHVNHAGQSVREGAEILGFDARQVDQPYSLVNRRALPEKCFPAVNNHFMSPFHQSWGKLDKESFRAAIGGRNPSSAKDSDAQLAVLD